MHELQRAGMRVVGVDLSPDSEFIEAIRTVAPVITGDARVHRVERVDIIHNERRRASGVPAARRTVPAACQVL